MYYNNKKIEIDSIMYFNSWGLWDVW